MCARTKREATAAAKVLEGSEGANMNEGTSERASERVEGGATMAGWMADCACLRPRPRRITTRPTMIGQRTFCPFWRRGEYITLLGRSFARLIPLGQEGTKMSTKTTASTAGGRAATVVARKDGQNGSRCLLIQREELDEWLRQLLTH